MSDWKEYPGNRLHKIVDGVTVIVPSSRVDITPFLCPVCDFAMRTYDDELSYREFTCCDRCAMLWAAPNREKWLSGWRPTQEKIEAANLERLPLSVSLKLE